MAEMKWYALVQRQKYGPVGPKAFLGWIAERRVTHDTLVWRSGLTDWVPAATQEDLRDALIEAGWKDEASAKAEADREHEPTLVAMPPLAEVEPDSGLDLAPARDGARPPNLTAAFLPPLRPSSPDPAPDPTPEPVPAPEDPAGEPKPLHGDDPEEEEDQATRMVDSAELLAQIEVSGHEPAEAQLQAQAPAAVASEPKEDFDEEATRMMDPSEISSPSLPAAASADEARPAPQGGRADSSDALPRPAIDARPLEPAAAAEPAPARVPPPTTAPSSPDLHFSGEPADLLRVMLLEWLVLVLSVGFYFPWFMVNLVHWFARNTRVRGQEVHFHAQTGEAFTQGMKFLLLSALTLGIYAPWGIVEGIRWIYARSRIGDHQPRFTGTGSQAFVEMFGVLLLSLVTLFGFLPWGLVRVNRFFARNTVVGRERLVYHGSPMEVLKIAGPNLLLTLLTLGIYTPWAVCKMWRYHASVTSFRRSAPRT